MATRVAKYSAHSGVGCETCAESDVYECLVLLIFYLVLTDYGKQRLSLTFLQMFITDRNIAIYATYYVQKTF